MDSEIALFWLKIVQQHPELEGEFIMLSILVRRGT